MRFARMLIILAALVSPADATSPAVDPATQPAGVPENVYRGELISYPGPHAFAIHRSSIILVSDEQLEALADPDKLINISLSATPQERSLRQICEHAKAIGQRTLVIAFDHFFAQYRPGQQGKPRKLTPDMDEYIARIAAVSRFAQGYGLGLELSLLSPLEIGPAYARQTGESGVWMHYREGVRDPKSGAYSVQLWRQRRWANNKGPLEVKDAGVRVFAFRERTLHGTPYSAVDPNEIIDVSDTARVEVWPDAVSRTSDFEAVRVRVYGQGGSANAAGLDRVLVVQMYHTPEMDYFSDKALPYMRSLIDRYADAGVKLNGLYADEMHIQQDWHYYSHHDHGEFALRYVSPGLARRFAALYGQEYGDFAKYLVYFVRGQHDFKNDLTAKDGAIHVLGDSPEAIRATALLRSRYYRLLQDGVVDLFTTAKHHAELRMGHKLEARAHATWAQSPTCDRWNTGQDHFARNHYEYTSNFLWSNTVQQAASACHDYFKWGDFLTGNGNDHTEGGWLDRNYYGLALACSTGILNEVPYSYAAHWGMPAEVGRRRHALVNAYGASAHPWYAMVQGTEHRDVEVLMLYPLDLVAADERFGSWMTQYGYANYITAAKLLERGKVLDGAIEVAGRRFTTLVTLFEPFPSKELLAMMRTLVEGGGRVVWSGPPPVLLADGTPALSTWQNLAGVNYAPAHNEGSMAPGRQVTFEGPLAGIPPMTILTDFPVDHIYPVSPREGTTPAARVKGGLVGAHRKLANGGSVTFLGFRPHDNQAKSLGYEERHWFDVLSAIGAYPPSGRFAGINDNTEVLSRTGGYLACRFPNGAVGVAPHLKDLEESWPGGFARDPKQDEALIKSLSLPSEHISLKDFHVNGHTVSYEGEQAVTFRLDSEGRLIGFCGVGSNQITVDGKTTVFADGPMPLVAWTPVDAKRRVPGGAVMQIRVHGAGTVRIPAMELAGGVRVVTEGRTPGSRGRDVPARLEGGTLVMQLDPHTTNHWLYALPAAPTAIQP